MQGLGWWVAGLLLASGNASAFDRFDLRHFRETNSCVRCDLSGANLQGADLFRADLQEANLSGANLQAAKLGEANLRGANLYEAELQKADLSEAELQKAFLLEAKLQKADLSEATLQKANLLMANLREANLSRATLRDANLLKANLWRAKLIRANLQEAKMGKATLQNAKLRWANMQEVSLGYASLQEADLTRANLQQARLSDTNLWGAILFGANLRGAELVDASLQEADLNEADLTEAVLTRAAFEDARMTDAGLSKALYQPATAPAQGFLSGLQGLPSVRFCPGEHSGLAQLRTALKGAGLRDLERQVTYALGRNETGYKLMRWRSAWPEPEWQSDFCGDPPTIDYGEVLEGVFRLVFFEWTTDYGLHYGRPLFILLGFIGVFTLVYLPAVATSPWRSGGDSGIYRIWPRERIERDSYGLTAADDIVVEPVRSWGLAAFGQAFYFSLVSAFHIGWRDLNVGSWIARMQPREYALRARGWVRVVSGLQSLISVYLIAMWALTYFGRPFE